MITVVHDPVEISNFTGRFNWSNYPLRKNALTEFDRVAVTTDEMYFQVTTRLKPKACYRLRTPVAQDISFLPRRNHERLRVGSSIRLNQKRGEQIRLPNSYIKLFWQKYLLNENGKFSLSQMKSFLGKSDRKNPKFLFEIETLLSQMKISVEFMGLHEESRLSRDSYLDWLEKLDVYVCTSTMEGGPIPLMEACQRGCAVVTTPVGQVSDWVVHGKSGYICSTPSEFADAILSYDTNRELLFSHQLKSVEVASRNEPNFESWADFILGR
jgi:hypothetical protein